MVTDCHPVVQNAARHASRRQNSGGRSRENLPSNKSSKRASQHPARRGLGQWRRLATNGGTRRRVRFVDRRAWRRLVGGGMRHTVRNGIYERATFNVSVERWSVWVRRGRALASGCVRTFPWAARTPERRTDNWPRVRDAHGIVWTSVSVRFVRNRARHCRNHTELIRARENRSPVDSRLRKITLAGGVACLSVLSRRWRSGRRGEWKRRGEKGGVAPSGHEARAFPARRTREYSAKRRVWQHERETSGAGAIALAGLHGVDR